MIVFGFLAKAISRLQPEQRVAAIIAQNQGLGGLIKRAGVIKSTITWKYKAVILGFLMPKEANTVIELSVI